MAQTVAGAVNTNGQPVVGSSYTSAVTSPNPYTVVVTFNTPYAAGTNPVGVTTLVGPPQAGVPVVSHAIQVTSTTLTFSTLQALPVAFYFIVTDGGL